MKTVRLQLRIKDELARQMEGPMDHAEKVLLARLKQVTVNEFRENIMDFSVSRDSRFDGLSTHQRITD